MVCYGNALSKLVVKLVVKHADSRAVGACATATLRGLRAGDKSKSSSSDSLFFLKTKYFFSFFIFFLPCLFFILHMEYMYE